MSLTRPSQVRAILSELGLRPSRSLGQNFLVDGNVLRILLNAAALTPDDRVLEIGPGLGVVTEGLVAAAGTVVVVEKDHRLAARLLDVYAEQPRVTVVPGDMLDQDPATVGGGAFTKVVSNLPYRDGTRILVDLVRTAAPPQRMVLTLQKEVGDRLAAAPGTSDYGQLGIWVQRLYDVAVIKTVSPTCFYPPPAVSSVIVTLSRHHRQPLDTVPEARFYALTKLAFQSRRKQLLTSLKQEHGIAAWLAANDLPREARPEQVPVTAWCDLAASTS